MPNATDRTLFLTSAECDGLASPAEYITAVREGYRQHGDSAPATPRTTLATEHPKGSLTGYSAILPDTGAMGGYMYAAGFGEQDAYFMLPLFDAESGAPLALLDGASINPFKTAAAGAVGVDELARKNASKLAIIGSSAQARGQLRAAATVRKFDSVSVYSPTKMHREKFAATMNERLEASVTAANSSAAALKHADVVITATNSSIPVFDGENLEAGTHVTAMGQYHPEKNELDATTIRRAKYVPDLRERVMNNAGSFINAVEEEVVKEDDIHSELGTVVAGKTPGRESSEEITVFDSGGTGIETVAAAYMLYEKACKQDLGTEITFAPASEVLTGE